MPLTPGAELLRDLEMVAAIVNRANGAWRARRRWN